MTRLCNNLIVGGLHTHLVSKGTRILWSRFEKDGRAIKAFKAEETVGMLVGKVDSESSFDHSIKLNISTDDKNSV